MKFGIFLISLLALLLGSVGLAIEDDVILLTVETEEFVIVAYDIDRLADIYGAPYKWRRPSKSGVMVVVRFPPGSTDRPGDALLITLRWKDDLGRVFSQAQTVPIPRWPAPGGSVSTGFWVGKVRPISASVRGLQWGIVRELSEGQ